MIRINNKDVQSKHETTVRVDDDDDAAADAHVSEEVREIYEMFPSLKADDEDTVRAIVVALDGLPVEWSLDFQPEMIIYEYRQTLVCKVETGVKSALAAARAKSPGRPMRVLMDFDHSSPGLAVSYAIDDVLRTRAAYDDKEPCRRAFPFMKPNEVASAVCLGRRLRNVADVVFTNDLLDFDHKFVDYMSTGSALVASVIENEITDRFRVVRAGQRPTVSLRPGRASAGQLCLYYKLTPPACVGVSAPTEHKSEQPMQGANASVPPSAKQEQEEEREEEEEAHLESQSIEDVVRLYAERLDPMTTLRLVHIIGLLHNVPRVWVAGKYGHGWGAPLDIDAGDFATTDAWIQANRCVQEVGVARHVRLYLARGTDGVVRVWAKTMRTFVEPPTAPQHQTALDLDALFPDLKRSALIVLGQIEGMLVDVPHVWIAADRRHRLAKIQCGTKDELAKAAVDVTLAIRTQYESPRKTPRPTLQRHAVLSMMREPDGKVSVGYKMASTVAAVCLSKAPRSSGSSN